jgi:hypothetical protein
MIKVLATDGVKTGESEPRATFTIGNQKSSTTRPALEMLVFWIAAAIAAVTS